MIKYIVENELDFYEELNKSFENSNIELKSDKCCLITNDILTDKFIKLDCGHCFNYIPLWNEIYNQKFNQSFYKTINISECIQCPYCRKIQNSLLPFYSDFEFKKTYGVTSNNEMDKISLVNNKWVYINTIKYFYGNCSYCDENNLQCQKTNVLLYENINKTFCYKHLNQIKSNELKLIKLQKIKEKQELKMKKIKEKQEFKMQKIKNNHPILAINVSESEDNLNSNINNNEIFKCQYIFKKGLNKDKQCCVKICSNNLCKKHISYSKI